MLATLVTLATPRAQAATLSFETTPGCPSRDDFVSSVEKRGGYLEAPGSAAQRRFDVVIRREGDAYVGTLTGDSGAVPQGEERKLQGSTCADVVEALAIALAVELQGEHAVPEPTTSLAHDSAVPAVVTPGPRVIDFRAASRWGHNVAPSG